MIQKDNEPRERARIIGNEQLVGHKAPKTHIDGTLQANRHFIDCIKRDRQPITNFEDAAKEMKALEENRLGPRTPSSF